jgi:carbon-monoxide dehydrogenase medium subunit
LKPTAFEYHVADTADAAVALLAELGDGAKVLAGGQSLIPMLSLRLTAFDHLVDVGRIDELARIHRDDGTLVVGATTLDADVGRNADVAAAVPLLTRVTPLIGHFQIRNRGTFGGSLAHADPAAEYPAVALALDAEVEALSPAGRRRIPAAEFFTGFWATSLADDELLTAARFPVWSGRCGFGVREFARRHGDFAVAGAVVAVQLDPDDRVARCAISMFGVGSTPVRATVAEEAVAGRADVAPDEVGRLAASGLTDVPADLHGSAVYRTQVAAAMVARAWADAIAEAREATHA